MKQYSFSLIFFSVLFFSLTACDKDQRCINYMDGEWTLISYETSDTNGFYRVIHLIDTTPQTNIDGRFVFNKYRKKKVEEGDAFLILTTTNVNFTNIDSTNFHYSITENGERIVLENQNTGARSEGTLSVGGKSTTIETYDLDNNQRLYFSLKKE